MVLGQISIVPLAVVDSFGTALQAGTHDLPDDSVLPTGDHLGPLQFASVEEDLPLLQGTSASLSRSGNLHKHIFNFHLSHARRVVDNAFGIMSSQFPTRFNRTGFVTGERVQTNNSKVQTKTHSPHLLCE